MLTAPAAQPIRERRVAPLERLERLCDPGTVHVLRSAVRSDALGAKARPGDGVVAAGGRVGGRPIFCYAQDSRFAGGSLGEAHADTIVRVLDLAAKARVPVVALTESAGARMQEGVAALGGYARIFRRQVALSGVVPQISIVTGTSAGGGCYSPGLTDFVIMGERSTMFLTGPQVVRHALGEDVDAHDLGGARVHSRNGVCQFVAPTHIDAVAVARRLLGYLPQSAGDQLPIAPAEDPAVADPGAHVPREPARVYDVRRVIEGIVDRDTVLEYAPRWAPNMVTALARLDGRPVGVVANQPKWLGGVIDVEASQKAAKFVNTCDAFRLPLVVIVDTPGFLPGRRQESAGIIRHGSELLHAIAHASVPKVSVVVRKAFGGAYITMNAKDLGADAVFAWPDAEIGIMSAEQAVRIVHRRELEHANGDGERLVRRYADEHLGARAAARRGFVDEIIAPAETRDRVAAVLAALEPSALTAPAPGGGLLL